MSRAVVLYVHGGGWTLRLHNLERRMLARMCRTATVPALAVDYRLAPEHPFPAALEDCISAYRWLLKNGTRPHDIVVVGFSAEATWRWQRSCHCEMTATRFRPPRFAFPR